MTNEVLKRQPFHKSLIDAICFAQMSDIPCLASLIKATQIPKGHDEIFEAWKQKTLELGLDDDLGVTADLLEQKKEAEERAKLEDIKDSKAARIGRYLLASVELTDQDIDRIWNALPGQARIELQAEALAEAAVRRARVRKETASS